MCPVCFFFTLPFRKGLLIKPELFLVLRLFVVLSLLCVVLEFYAVLGLLRKVLELFS